MSDLDRILLRARLVRAQADFERWKRGGHVMHPDTHRLLFEGTVAPMKQVILEDIWHA